MNSRLKTMEEAAEYLNIPKSSLYKLCSKNELLYRKIGRNNRFTIEDLEEFIQRQKVKRTNEKEKINFRKVKIKL
ncbi:helix-turn-helix domain-containing protein [Flagellimonas marinaquae]